MYNALSMYTPIFICIYLYSYLYSKYMCMYTLHTRRTAIHTIDNNAPLETKSLKCINECSPRPLRVVGSNVARSRPSFYLRFFFFSLIFRLPPSSFGARDRSNVLYFRKATLRRIWPRRSACHIKK